MSADPREAELPWLEVVVMGWPRRTTAGPPVDLRSYMLALTDAQLSALGLTRRREGQPKGDETVIPAMLTAEELRDRLVAMREAATQLWDALTAKQSLLETAIKAVDTIERAHKQVLNERDAAHDALAASEGARKRVEALSAKWRDEVCEHPGSVAFAVVNECAAELESALAQEPESEGQPAEGEGSELLPGLRKAADLLLGWREHHRATGKVAAYLVAFDEAYVHVGAAAERVARGEPAECLSPLASPREAPKGEKDGSAAVDTAGSAGVSAVPNGGALGSLPLTPEAPRAGEIQWHDWRITTLEYDGTFFRCYRCGEETHCRRGYPEPGVCRGTGTARPAARPAEVDDPRANTWRDVAAYPHTFGKRLRSADSGAVLLLREIVAAAVACDEALAQVAELQAQQKRWSAEADAIEEASRERYEQAEARAAELQAERDEALASRARHIEERDALARVAEAAEQRAEKAEAKLEAARGLLKRGRYFAVASKTQGGRDLVVDIDAFSALLAKPSASEPEDKEKQR